MLKGRLGLETARIPHTDRHGLMWLEYGKLVVEEGNVCFITAGNEHLRPGAYSIPCQLVSNIILGPGTTVSHDALRILARQGTGLLAVGEKGVRVYAVSMPSGPDRSKMARAHVKLWYPEDSRIDVAREMYRIRLGGELPVYNRDLNTLRGIEGQRMKALYERFAQQYKVQWKGRRFDRSKPEDDDAINTAINHSATACYAAASIAVASMGAIPQLGFIHENSSKAFPLDIADLFRHSFTLPVAFSAVSTVSDGNKENMERATRRLAAKTLQRDQVIPKMIDHIKNLIKPDDNSSDT